MVNLPVIRNHVVLLLEKGLSPLLTYHNVDHTLDVAKQCMRIAEGEGITDAQQLLELEIAALYHDTGFLYVYKNHEERGCTMAREELPEFGLDKAAIENICSIIMATKVPQTPASHLQQIICDADLDYLGRGDFFTIAAQLQTELLQYRLVNSLKEWEKIQWSFLQSHHYFTQTSKKERAPVKLRNMQQIADNKTKQEG
jgi:uncharacterized protein